MTRKTDSWYKYKKKEWLKVKPFIVTVHGFPPRIYVAANRGKANAKAYEDYEKILGLKNFSQFMTMVTTYTYHQPHRNFGRIIYVNGSKAFWVGGDDHQIEYVYPDSETIIVAYENEVEWTDDYYRFPKGWPYPIR